MRNTHIIRLHFQLNIRHYWLVTWRISFSRFIVESSTYLERKKIVIMTSNLQRRVWKKNKKIKKNRASSAAVLVTPILWRLMETFEWRKKIIIRIVNSWVPWGQSLQYLVHDIVHTITKMLLIANWQKKKQATCNKNSFYMKSGEKYWE